MGQQKLNPTCKSAINKSEVVLKEETLKIVPKDLHLEQDAYNWGLKSSSIKEYIYHFVPITTIWLSPMEEKYAHLSAAEVMTFYSINFTDPFMFPKDYTFFIKIFSIILDQ